MRAGRLRHKVVFERYTETENDFGEPVQTWTTLHECAAGIEPISGGEKQAVYYTQADANVRIVTRYSSELSTLNRADRVRHGTTIYDIKFVNNIDMRNKELHIMAREHIE